MYRFLPERSIYEIHPLLIVALGLRACWRCYANNSSTLTKDANVADADICWLSVEQSRCRYGIFDQRGERRREEKWETPRVVARANICAVTRVYRIAPVRSILMKQELNCRLRYHYAGTRNLHTGSTTAVITVFATSEPKHRIRTSSSPHSRELSSMLPASWPPTSSTSSTGLTPKLTRNGSWTNHPAKSSVSRPSRQHPQLRPRSITIYKRTLIRGYKNRRPISRIPSTYPEEH